MRVRNHQSSCGCDSVLGVTSAELRARVRADSVLGVTLFRDNAPYEFGYFTLALYSMFRLTAGETQVASPPAPSALASPSENLRARVDYRQLRDSYIGNEIQSDSQKVPANNRYYNI